MTVTSHLHENQHHMIQLPYSTA